MTEAIPPAMRRLLEAMNETRLGGYTPQEAALYLWPDKDHKGRRGNGLAMAAGSLLARLTRLGYATNDSSYSKTMRVYIITTKGIDALYEALYDEHTAAMAAARAKADAIIQAQPQWAKPTSALAGLRDAIAHAIREGSPYTGIVAANIMATHRRHDWRGREGEERLHQAIIKALDEAAQAKDEQG